MHPQRVLAALACTFLAGCARPGTPQPTRLPPIPTQTRTQQLDNGVENPLPISTPQPFPSLEPTPSTPSIPIPTPDAHVLDFDPADLVLLPEELPGPYLFSLASSTHATNSEIPALLGQDIGTRYVSSSGRVDGIRAEFDLNSADPSAFLILSLGAVTFKGNSGPAFLVKEVGGPCLFAEPGFTLVDSDLGIGDFSLLCQSDLEYWLRAAYRNVYFEVRAIGIPPTLDKDLVIAVAAAQLAKLQSLPLSVSMYIPPSATPTTTWSPTPAGTAEVFPAPSKGPSWITEGDNGKAFFYYPTIRFGLDLDPTYYLKRDLDYSECEHTGLGEISNWSLNGPDSLPVGFEASEVGECTIRVRDFRVHIVVVDWP